MNNYQLITMPHYDIGFKNTYINFIKINDKIFVSKTVTKPLLFKTKVEVNSQQQQSSKYPHHLKPLEVIPS